MITGGTSYNALQYGAYAGGPKPQYPGKKKTLLIS